MGLLFGIAVGGSGKPPSALVFVIGFCVVIIAAVQIFRVKRKK
jgi:hypothetical protein